MSLKDLLESKFLEEFSSITVGSLLTALLLAFALSLFIVLIYRVTYAGAMFSKSFAFCLVLLAMVTSLVILTISSNVVLSLGMVGALSIVRFRTAVKEPMDTVFMFWAIAVGIITGAGFIPVAVIATLVIGVLFLAMTLAGAKLGASAYLLVVRYEAELDKDMMKLLNKYFKFKLKSKNMAGSSFELVLETRLSEKQLAAASKLRTIDGVQEVNIISYTGSTML